MFVNEKLYYYWDAQQIDYVLMTTNDVFKIRVNDLDIYVGLQIEQDCS